MNCEKGTIEIRNGTVAGGSSGSADSASHAGESASHRKRCLLRAAPLENEYQEVDSGNARGHSAVPVTYLGGSIMNMPHYLGRILCVFVLVALRSHRA